MRALNFVMFALSSFVFVQLTRFCALFSICQVQFLQQALEKAIHIFSCLAYHHAALCQLESLFAGSTNTTSNMSIYRTCTSWRYFQIHMLRSDLQSAELNWKTAVDMGTLYEVKMQYGINYLLITWYSLDALLKICIYLKRSTAAIQGMKLWAGLQILSAIRLQKTGELKRLLASVPPPEITRRGLCQGVPPVTPNTTEVGLGKEYMVLIPRELKVWLLPSGHSQAAPLEVLSALAAVQWPTG